MSFNKHVGALSLKNLRFYVSIEGEECLMVVCADKTYFSANLSSVETKALSSLLGAAHRAMHKNALDKRIKERVAKATKRKGAKRK